jgi:hypothetical protein
MTCESLALKRNNSKLVLSHLPSVYSFGKIYGKKSIWEEGIGKIIGGNKCGKG